MREKRRIEKIKPAAELEKTTTEILVANGHFVEPFIKIFNYSGENIATKPLGALIGVFEISEQSEDSAYIVNFLSSVAKKEYFLNPRRGAVESFEAALHKINLALSMLVKHGNTAWLGKLHGAIGILEKNNIHFSATGEAKILLLRNNYFSEISTGLASEESFLHPVKTFVEVSSGRLFPNDKIIISSPELPSLLPLDDLKKNAIRMDNEHFAQFLHTALVNELNMAGTIIMDIYEGQPAIIKKQTIQREETIQNVFSKQAFAAPIKTKNTDRKEKNRKNPDNTSKSEYIDSKTGHIYVQGDIPNKSLSHPSMELAQLLLQETVRQTIRFSDYQRKALRKGKKQSSLFIGSTLQQGFIIAKQVLSFLQRQLKKIFFLVHTKLLLRTPTKLPKKKSMQNLLNHLLLFRKNYVSRQKSILVGSVFFIALIFIGGIFFWTQQINKTLPDNGQKKAKKQTEAPVLLPIDTKKNAHLLQEPVILATVKNQNIATIILNDEIYLVTTREIINVREEKHYELPQNSGGVLLTAPMNDLSLIFIYTDTKKLFAWSAINHTFIQNTLLLPETSRVKDIDTYLTYLYVLDDIDNQIYRFPRAEGGFGQSSAWLKDSIAFGENTQAAINENIFLAPEKDSIQIFFRGRYVKNFESPNTSLAVTNLFAAPGLTNIYALDTENKRVIAWNQDGSLIAQYFSEKLSDAQTIAVSERTNEIFIVVADTLLSFKIPNNQTKKPNFP